VAVEDGSELGEFRLRTHSRQLAGEPVTIVGVPLAVGPQRSAPWFDAVSRHDCSSLRFVCAVEHQSVDPTTHASND
jgi:hypothetical protein